MSRRKLRNSCGLSSKRMKLDKPSGEPLRTLIEIHKECKTLTGLTRELKTEAAGGIDVKDEDFNIADALRSYQLILSSLKSDNVHGELKFDERSFARRYDNGQLSEELVLTEYPCLILDRVRKKVIQLENLFSILEGRVVSCSFASIIKKITSAISESEHYVRDAIVKPVLLNPEIVPRTLRDPKAHSSGDENLLNDILFDDLEVEPFVKQLAKSTPPGYPRLTGRDVFEAVSFFKQLPDDISVALSSSFRCSTGVTSSSGWPIVMVKMELIKRRSENDDLLLPVHVMSPDFYQTVKNDEPQFAKHNMSPDELHKIQTSDTVIIALDIDATHWHFIAVDTQLFEIVYYGWDRKIIDKRRDLALFKEFFALAIEIPDGKQWTLVEESDGARVDVNRPKDCKASSLISMLANVDYVSTGHHPCYETKYFSYFMLSTLLELKRNDLLRRVR